MRPSSTRPRRIPAVQAKVPARGVHAVTTRLLPGELRTTSNADESLVTVLGSCIAACVRNPVTGFGGMNHFMLPESQSGDWNGTDCSGRYGNLAMDALIAEVVNAGCPKQFLDIKIFGGADLYRGSTLVGRKNVEFVTSYLAKAGLNPTARDIGGTLARKIIFTPSTGRALRQLIKPHSDEEIVELEKRYQLALQRSSGRIRDIATEKV